MKLDESPGKNAAAVGEGTDYDEIYAQSWEAALAQCHRRLEPDDLLRALEVKSANDFREELNDLVSQLENEDPAKALIMLVYPVLDQFETFVSFFVKMMSKPVEVSMLWGLLFLVITLSLESEESTVRISRILRIINHKMAVLNGCSHSLTDYSVIKNDTVEIHKEIMNLWLNIIMIYRNQSLEGISQAAWETLSSTCTKALGNIEEAVDRFREIANLAQVQSQQSQTIDFELFQRVLSLNHRKTQVEEVVPCHYLPVAKNTRFFGRQTLLQEIDHYLQPSTVDAGFSSLAIYGLGGVGKTQIALSYAYEKLSELDAVFWIPAETDLGLKQAFTSIAIDTLKLPNARPQAHQENLVLVMSWLHRTSAKWLLILDNVEDHSVFSECWPVAQHGAILITTRHPNVATQPVDNSIEIPTFGIKEGAEFLEHLLAKKTDTESEQLSSLQVSSKLDGHALALNQIAALMNARRISSTKFLNLYDKNPRRIHREHKAGWKYIGYQHALDTVWKMSFESLDKESSLCLGILSLLSAELVPYAMFEVPEDINLPEALSFCQDDFRRDDVMETLLNHAIVRRDDSNRFLSVHRLIQAEYLFQTTMEERQEAFEAAIALLLEVFPHFGQGRVIDSNRHRAEPYIQHVLSLIFNYSMEKDQPNALKSTLKFLELIGDCAWYLYYSFGSTTLGKVVDIGFDAARGFPATPDYMRCYTSILYSAHCYEIECRGDFRAAERYMQSCLDTRLKYLSPEDELICACYTTLGNALSSSFRFKEAIMWFKKADSLALKHGNEWPMRRLLVNLNSSRAYYSVGEYTEAARRLDSALGECSLYNSKFWAARVQMAYASLHIRTGKLDYARKSCEATWKILEEDNMTHPTLITSRYFYKLGYIAMHQDQISEAVENFEQAVAICKLRKCSTGLLARATYALSKALLKTEARHHEGQSQQTEAQRLRKQALKECFDPVGDDNDDSFEAFEMLVDIMERT